ncbi:CYTH domain-containing protein [Salibacterium aidingense]|uniref:CYTH domain-containing protein n=1 Tax=Salibacterium aidingense TaxID=384933 RepID=UPI003BD86004
MAKETEIEEKNLLTRNEFDMLADTYQIKPPQFFWQANTYFDTPALEIKEQGAALRVRTKSNNYELTLKQPASAGLLETNQTLTEVEAKRLMEQAELPEGEVKESLHPFIGDTSMLQKLGTLETYRAQTSHETGILFLDHSVYLDTEDFELEIEGSSEEEVRKWLTSILTDHDIPARPTPNKIKRFFTRKQELAR